MDVSAVAWTVGFDTEASIETQAGAVRTSTSGQTKAGYHQAR